VEKWKVFSDAHDKIVDALDRLAEAVRQAWLICIVSYHDLIIQFTQKMEDSWVVPWFQVPAEDGV
jgi:hypothetical protein